MIRLGIIGSLSMHARAFAEVCNLPLPDGSFAIPDCRVTTLCGLDDTPDHTAEIADGARIPHTVQTPDALFPLCDAVIVATRDGGTHVPCALPFLQRGYPVFLDKPLCISTEDVRRLEEMLQSRPCILDGGSAMRYSTDLHRLKAEIDAGAVGSVKSVTVCHTADIGDKNGGIFFYAPHAAEVMLYLLGGDVRGVETAVLDRRNFSVFVRYEDRFAQLIFTEDGWDCAVTVRGNRGTRICAVGTEGIFREAMIHFAACIRENRFTRSAKALTEPVRILQRIQASLSPKEFY